MKPITTCDSDLSVIMCFFFLQKFIIDLFPVWYSHNWALISLLDYLRITYLIIFVLATETTTGVVEISHSFSLCEPRCSRFPRTWRSGDSSRVLTWILTAWCPCRVLKWDQQNIVIIKTDLSRDPLRNSPFHPSRCNVFLMQSNMPLQTKFSPYVVRDCWNFCICIRFLHKSNG